MTIKHLLHFCLPLLTLSVFAQSTETTLWEISGNGLKKNSYFYASSAFVAPNLIEIPDSALWALQSTEAIAVDILTDELMTARFEAFLRLPKGIKMSDSLTQEQAQSIKLIWEKHFEGEAPEYENYRAAFIYQKLMEKYWVQGSGASFKNWVQDFGKANAKKLLSIETLEEHFDVLRKKNETYIIETFGQTGQYALYPTLSLSAHQSGNFEPLLKQLQEDPYLLKASEYELAQAFATKQLDRIEKMMRMGSVFFALDALPLIGENGLLNALKNKGFTIRPVISNKAVTYPKLDLLKDWANMKTTDAKIHFKMPMRVTPEFGKENDDKGNELKISSYYLENHNNPHDPNTFYSFGVIEHHASSGINSGTSSQQTIKELFDEVALGIVGNVEGKITFAVANDYEGYPGRRFEVKMNGKKQALGIYVQVVLVANRLVISQCGYPLIQSRNSFANAFFNSITIK